MGYAERLLRFNLLFVDFVQSHRKSKERITRVVETSLKAFKYYAMYDQVKQAQQVLQEHQWKNDNFEIIQRCHVQNT